MRSRNSCDNCAVRERALCSALPAATATALSRAGLARRIQAGQVIQSEDRDLSWFAIIVSGVVKLVKTLHDGRQQIVGLQFPSDFVGRPYATRSTLIAEATTDLELCCFSRSAFEGMMREHPALERALLQRTLNDLDVSREWMFLLGRKSAEEKVASLLVHVAERTDPSRCEGAARQASLAFELPLSRTEMADTLGVTIETVSREIRSLRSRGLIALKGRRGVSVPNLAELKALADGGRQ